jgi:hypothetical protein
MNVNTKLSRSIHIFYRILSITLIAAFMLSSNAHAMHAVAKKRVAVTKRIRPSPSKPRITQRSTCIEVVNCYSCHKYALAHKNPDDFRRNLEEYCCNPAYPLLKEILPELVETGDVARTEEALKFNLLKFPTLDANELLTRKVNALVKVAQKNLEQTPYENRRTDYQEIITLLTDYAHRQKLKL